MTLHSLELHKDDGGWDYGVCDCGWRTPPVPGADIVADSFAEHRVVNVSGWVRGAWHLVRNGE